MSKQDYKITAGSLEDFQQIQKDIEELSIATKSQISRAEKNITLVYIYFKETYDKKISVLLPHDIIDLNVSENGFSCFNSKFNFEMKKNPEQRFLFNFTKPKP